MGIRGYIARVTLNIFAYTALQCTICTSKANRRRVYFECIDKF